MAILNRASIASQLLPGLNAIMGLEYKNVDQEDLALFDADTSDKAFEEVVMMSGFETAPTKAEGAAVEYASAQESYKAVWTNETIAQAFAITEEALEDNLYDTFSKIKAKALGRSVGNTVQTKAANIFNNGFSTSYPIGDGVALFSASHPTVGAGTQSNTASTDLSETALENALISISQFKDDQGILIGAQVRSLHIPPQLQFVSERILRSPGRTGTADNDINAVKSMGMLPKGYSVNHRFTDTNAWFLRTDVPFGFIKFTRVPLQTKMEGDFDTGNMRYKARMRLAYGVGDWRAGYGSAGSS